MRKQNRSCDSIVTAKQKFNFGARLHQNSIIKDKENKRGYSAEGYSLLTSALRPRLFGIGILAGVVTVVGICLNYGNNQVYAVSAILSVPEGISVNVNPSSNNGFAESNNGAISVSTGNQMGYTLTIKAKDNNQLKNGSNVLNSISSNLTADQYKNGDYVNTWGMKPSSINSSTNTSYVPGPTTSGIIIAQTNMNSTTAENYSLGIAAKVDSNTVAGNYGNTFVLTATANDAHYNITFNKNGGSGGPSATQTGSIGSSTTVTIASGTPTYSNKDFLGWCTENPGTGDTCNGALIQPGGKFPLCKCDLNITLYAMYGTAAPVIPTTGGDCSHSGYSGTAKYYADLCWMWQDVSGNFTWTDALNACPTGWRLPSQAEFQNLLNAIGRGNQLYTAGWRHSTGNYWSTTPYNTGGAYYLVVSSNSASITNGSNRDGYTSTSNPFGVRCVAG